MRLGSDAFGQQRLAVLPVAVLLAVVEPSARRWSVQQSDGSLSPPSPSSPAISLVLNAARQGSLAGVQRCSSRSSCRDPAAQSDGQSDMHAGRRQHARQRLRRRSQGHSKARRGMSDWHPPETAPQDGSVFLITTAGAGVDLCSSVQERNRSRITSSNRRSNRSGHTWSDGKRSVDPLGSAIPRPIPRTERMDWRRGLPVFVHRPPRKRA